MSEPNEPARPDQPEPDSDQLPIEDTLVDRGVDDLLDEGVSPPDRPRTNRWGETPLEEVLGESHDRRLAQEEPEAWEQGHTRSPAREPDRTGRLTADDDEDTDPTGTGSQHLMADDVGVAGGGASAEEAAMHLVPEESDLAPDAAQGNAEGDGAAPLPDPTTDATADDEDLTSPDR